MDERIKEHLKRLNQYYLLLLDARKVSQEEFFEDSVRRASTERFMHLAIESCLNIGNRMLALYQFEKPVKPPETYADIFRGLQTLGVIEVDFTGNLVEMAKLRNRLVHLYWEVDMETIYRILHENLDDFKRFQQNVVEYLNNNPLQVNPDS